MGFWKRAIMLYVDGFRNLKLGKVLWRVIIIKLLIIFALLKVFVYDKNLSHIGDEQAKSAFVMDNLTKSTNK
ncbi:DUF4492 domain-containing protein [Helicobacter jaachi]|uniref:DUF4492 domain-containing protein n=1 Tax=Helicobacter jaachi TaxID=1677920 RepID=A0A4U8TCY6_9HELI|nr:DUF4492 domain-containing protein [Helicobacter jaachi]